MKNTKPMFSLKKILVVKAKDRLEKVTHREDKRKAKLSKKEQDNSPVSNFYTEAKELIDALDKSNANIASIIGSEYALQKATEDEVDTEK